MSVKRNQAILANCSNNWQHKYQQDDAVRRVWTKLNKPQTIIDLLLRSSGNVRHMARLVLERMEKHKEQWQIRATTHKAEPSDERGFDAGINITLRAGGTKYYLRLEDKPSLHITQVTR